MSEIVFIIGAAAAILLIVFFAGYYVGRIAAMYAFSGMLDRYRKTCDEIIKEVTK